MRTIIAGSRSITDYNTVVDAVQSSSITPSVIISGTARGVDQLGERYGTEHGIPIERYPAQWKKYKQRAGFIRNVQMGEVADALILVWDGQSNGSKHMLEVAYSMGLHIYVHTKLLLDKDI